MQGRQQRTGCNLLEQKARVTLADLNGENLCAHG